MTRLIDQAQNAWVRTEDATPPDGELVIGWYGPNTNPAVLRYKFAEWRLNGEAYPPPAEWALLPARVERQGGWQ